MLPKSHVVDDIKSVPWSGGINYTVVIAFSSRRNEKLTTVRHVFFSKGSHNRWKNSFSCHQNSEQRLYVDDRNLCVSWSLRNRIKGRQNVLNAFRRSHVRLSLESLDPPWIAFSGHQNEYYTKTGSYINLTLESQESHFQSFKMQKSNAMKARYLRFQGLMTLKKSYFQFAKMPKSAWYEVSCPRVEDFTTQLESHFQATKVMKTLVPRVS